MCGDRTEKLQYPPSCINSKGVEVEKKKSFSASFHAYSIKNEDRVRFTLFDMSNTKKIIEEVKGVLEDFGGRYPHTERCAYYLAHTFELPISRSWPDTMLVEVEVINKDSTFQLILGVNPN